MAVPDIYVPVRIGVTMSAARNLGPASLVDLNVLLNWDLARIKAKLVHDSVCTQERADAIEVQYKHYLAVSMSNPGLPAPISVEVDQMWHQHILFTRDYAAMCDRVCGRFIHHKPCESDEEQVRLSKDYQANTLPLMRQMFGEVDPAFWSADGAICWDGGKDD